MGGWQRYDDGFLESALGGIVGCVLTDFNSGCFLVIDGVFSFFDTRSIPSMFTTNLES